MNYAMKRVAAGAHLPTPWVFEPAKRPDDRADYCLGLPKLNLFRKLRKRLKFSKNFYQAPIKLLSFYNQNFYSSTKMEIFPEKMKTSLVCTVIFM